MNQRRKVAFHTLGCKLNFAETSAISRSFPEDRFEKVKDAGMADIHVINTCSVTDAADRKCRQTIRKLIRNSPDAYIAVVGCYAQLRPDEISSIPGVDLVLGTNEKFDVAAFLDGNRRNMKAEIHSCSLSEKSMFNPSWSAGDRTRSFLKVQDGCDYHCSYCTIPLARGHSRNQPVREIVSEAELIAAEGIREVVLTGVNIGDFGKSTGESFIGLLRELVKVKGISRFRISSIEPNLLTEELIDLASAEPAIMPHFHVPLQSGCNRILKLMKRRYTREMFASRVAAIKEKMPLAGIGADIITGFPGETEADFEDTFSFLDNLPLSYLHVFNYSERPGTEASRMPEKVPQPERERRSRLLTGLSDKKRLEFTELNTGRTAEVLFEQKREKGLISGFTENYLRAYHSWQSDLSGRIVRVRLVKSGPDGRLITEII